MTKERRDKEAVDKVFAFERQLLGMLWYHPHSFWAVWEMLKPEDFTDTLHRSMYLAYAYSMKQCEMIDYIFVFRYCISGARVLLSYLMEGVSERDDPIVTADLLAEQAHNRVNRLNRFDVDTEEHGNN